MEEFLRLTKPKIPDLSLVSKYFQKSVDARWYTNFGPCYEELKSKIEDRTGADQVLLVANATIALELVLKVTKKNLGKNSKRKFVITPSYTFAATTTSILSAGLFPIFVDVDLDDWHAAVEDVRAIATQHSESVACLLLCSTFGTTPSKEKLDEWKESATDIGVPLFIDVAAGFGANFDLNQNEVGIADATIYSMHATKAFAVGEGGIIAGKSELIDSCKRLSNFDFDIDRNFTEFGTNGKISEIMCATGLVVLDNYSETLINRRRVASMFKASLVELEKIKFQNGSDFSTWQSLYLRILDERRFHEVLKELKDSQIEFRRDWSNPTHKSIRSEISTNLHNTDVLAASCLTLPLWEEMEEAHVQRISQALIRALT
jgi:dTDP-4-amino-4,6-dideoxygalactose transaminase